MQASRLTAIAGCEMSACGCFLASNLGRPRFIFLAQRSSSFSFEYCRSGMSESRSSRPIFCERARALDLAQAGAAVAAGPHAGLVAEVRNLDAVLLRRLDDRLVGAADDGPAVELELDRHHRELLRRYPFHRKRLSTLLSRAGNTALPSAPDSAPPAPGRRSKRPSWPEKAL